MSLALKEMKLKLTAPSKILYEGKIQKCVVETVNGALGILPNFIDATVALDPGIFSFYDDNSKEIFFAIDKGLLVKQKDLLLIATRRAAKGENLGDIRNALEKEILELEEGEKKSRSASALVESSIVKKFKEQIKFENQ